MSCRWPSGEVNTNFEMHVDDTENLQYYFVNIHFDDKEDDHYSSRDTPGTLIYQYFGEPLRVICHYTQKNSRQNISLLVLDLQ